MRDHSPTARHPSTPQSRQTTARKRRQLARVMASISATAVTPLPVALAIQAPTLLQQILATHTVRRI